MRLLTFTLVLLSSTAALGATLLTPAGRIDLPQPHGGQHLTKENPAPPIAPNVSWGKAGVSYAQYSQDKLYCAYYGLKYALGTPVWAIKGHLNMATLIENGGMDNAQFRQSGQEEVEHCLSLRGYDRFRLTADQFTHLSNLKPGSLERQQYLYALASNAVVLEKQKI